MFGYELWKFVLLHLLQILFKSIWVEERCFGKKVTKKLSGLGPVACGIFGLSGDRKEQGI